MHVNYRFFLRPLEIYYEVKELPFLLFHPCETKLEEDYQLPPTKLY